jgi:glutaredoxin-dependent peroxiredoxin
MALQVGTKAPDFTLCYKSESGLQVVKLSDNFGKKKTLLLFFPMAFTGTCTAEMCSISKEFETYDNLNTVVYAVSGDSPFSLEAWAQKEGISVPLLSDYTHSVTKAYGVAYESFPPGANLPISDVAKRSAFVIDRNGVVQYSESSDNPKQLPNFEAIRAKLTNLD